MTVSQYMWNLMLNDEKFAYEFADRAHTSVNQIRKYNKMPYIEHPVRVAETVLYYQGTSEMVQAALLHDVVEDTGVTSETIHKFFGPKVGELVDWLTDISRPHHGNRATRKKMDRDHSIASPAEAQTIKLADLIDNCTDIVANDPHFARVYLKEMGLLLESLDKADKRLLEEAKKVYAEGVAKLKESRDVQNQ